MYGYAEFLSSFQGLEGDVPIVTSITTLVYISFPLI